MRSERDTGDSSFRETLLDVATDAIAVDDTGLLVRAVLANSRGFVSIVGDVDADRVALIEAALVRLPAGSLVDRARLEALLAVELVFDPDRRAECLGLVDHSVALLEEIDDPSVEAAVLGITRFAEMVPERWTVGVERAERAVAAADRCADPDLRVRNRIAHQWALMSADELDRARSVAEEYLAIAADGAGPTMQWSARAFACQFHLHVGDLASAAAENDVALEVGLELGAVDCESWWAGTVAIILWTRDNGYPDADLAGEMADRFPGALAWRTSQAFALALEGRAEECRTIIEVHGLGDPTSFPRDMFHFSCFLTMARAVGTLDDAALARPLLAAAEPYAERVSHYGVGLAGSMREALGLLRSASGDLDGGITEMRAALDWATRHRLELWRVMYRVMLAELLVRRAGPAELAEVRTVLAETLPEAERLGMVGWVTRGAAVLDEIE